MQNNLLKMILLAEEFYNLANELQELGQLERAVDNYRRSLEIYPNYAEVHNNLGNVLCELGQAEEAVSSYQRALVINPDYADAHSNLGNVLRDLGQIDIALSHYRRALEIKPDSAQVHFNLGYILLDQGDLAAAEQYFNLALEEEPDLTQAHQGLACIFQRCGSDELSRYHRDRGFGKQPLSTLSYQGRGTPIQLLVLGSALEGNLPWRFLIDRNTFQTTILAVEYFDEQLPLPPHQLILNAIGDADICQQGLEIATRLIQSSQTRVANPPQSVLLTGRLINAQRLGAISGVTTPRMLFMPKSEIDSRKISELLSNAGLNFPLLLRPPGFHRGNYFVCVDSVDALILAMEKLPGEQVLAIEYLDSRSQDGLFRKYRVMSINGSLYPIHMAVSSQWMVHYFSSDMDKNAQYREEEQAFLNEFAAFLGADVMAVLEKMSKMLGLDYCGIDFGIDQQGNVLLFEANSTMLINQLNDEKQWDYRRAAINNALAAAKNMLAGWGTLT
jgi:Tfp pilus assembly protein PilF/glutathione synthase/RimK-type ligase-like ATP-grasp enzyme